MTLSHDDYSQILRRELLPQVQKPARYIGGEWNEVRKDPGSVATRGAGVSGCL